jgi:hypothetical protein
MAIGVNANISSGDIASTTGTTTITLPTGTNSDDVLVVVIANDFGAVTAQSTTGPSGWTSIFSGFTVTSGSNHIQLNAFWALGSVANLGFTNSQTGGNYQQGWVCLGFTGVDNTTPIDATSGSNDSNTGASSLTVSSVTVATDQAWELIAFNDWLGKVAFTASGFAEKNNAAANASVALLYNTTPKSTGATGTVSVANSDGTSGGEILAGSSFALRPSSPPPPPPGAAVAWIKA